MALVVWCPLLGNNSQQGLSSVTLTSPGSTMSVVNDGKLGKTYDNSSRTAGGFKSNAVIDLGSTQSMFCWFRFTSLTSDSALGCGLISQHRYSNNTGLGLNVKYVSATTGYITVSTGTGSGRTYNTYCGSTLLQANTWYHVGFTYDGDNVLKLYVNGVCDGTHNVGKMSTPADYIMLYCWSLSGSSGSSVYGNYILNGAMNDARIYDECLSPKEIEILARGLVLHYPLSLSMPNLAKGSNTDSTSTNMFRFSEATGGSTNTIEYDGGIPCAKITRNSTAHSSWSFLYYGNWDRAAIKPSTTYTLSFDIIGSGSGSIGFSGFMQSNATNSISASVEGIQNTFNADKWSHIVLRTTTIADFTDKGTSQIIYMNCSYLHNTDVWIMMKNMKLEEGVNDTPWIPHTSDTGYSTMGLGSTTEYDVSGYNYHGTKIGSPTYSSDTPKYSVSTSFNGIDDCIQVPLNTFFPNAGSFTINLWFKKHEIGSKNYETVFGGISGFEMDTRNGSSTTLSYYVTGSSRGLTVQSPLNLDTWYMLTMVCDGTNELYYLNGEYKKQIEKKGMPTGNYFIGAWNSATQQNFKGLISDFRVYATALSAIQVAELYNTSASISNNGTLLAYEFTEN